MYPPFWGGVKENLARFQCQGEAFFQVRGKFSCDYNYLLCKYLRLLFPTVFDRIQE